MSHFQKSHSYPKKQPRVFGNRASDRSSNRPRSGFSDRDSFKSNSRGSNLELTRVTCDSCGKQTEVPFKPTGEKPVYCRDCFRQQSSAQGGRSDRFESRSRTSDRHAPEDHARPSSEDFEQINRKLDKIMEALDIE